MFDKYSDMPSQFNEMRVVNDLIYNEATKMVAVFKDYLIMDDINEFLKRKYTKKEFKERVPKLA